MSAIEDKYNYLKSNGFDLGAPLVQQLPAGIANRTQPGPRIKANRRNVVIIAHRTSSNDGDTDGIRGRVTRHRRQAERQKAMK